MSPEYVAGGYGALAALTEEQRTSAQLRAELHTLHDQVARLETGFIHDLSAAREPVDLELQ